MAKTGYFETPPSETDIPAPKLDATGSTGILLSTLWSQSGVFSIGSNSSIQYNEYTPIDPSTSIHSVTGCTNTAAAQILYYFIEKKGLKLTLTLQSDDAYTSKNGRITIKVKDDGSTPGTVSFATVNSRLENYQLNSAVHAATLMYACGVVQKASYSSTATSTSWATNLFYRAGLQSANHFYLGSTPGASSYWGANDENGNFTISDAGLEVIIENLLAGRPVGASFPGHALVIDGYNADKDLFHVNFGWGKTTSTRWYSRSEMREQGYYQFIYDLFTERIETLTVTSSHVYGTGTMVRAMEQAWSITGSNTVSFSSAVSGKSVTLTEYMKIKDSTTIRDFNMSVTVNNARLFSWGTAFYAEAGSVANFENFGGDLIVNTDKSNNVAVYCDSKSRLSFSANNTLIYGGNYAYGTADVLSAMRTARTNGTTPSTSVTDAAQYSFYGSDNDDSIVLSGNSLVIGKVNLRGGGDVIALTDNSRLYGDINSSDSSIVLNVTDNSRLYGNINGSGSKTITIDSTSSITGRLYSTLTLGFNFVLNSVADNHALFTATDYAYYLYSRATVSVDIANAEFGTYVLFAADPDDSYADYLDRLTLTVTGSGEADYTLCCNGTSTSKYADVVYEDLKFKLNVKVAPDSLLLPKVISVYASTTAATRSNVTVYAEFNSNIKAAQYSLDGSIWSTYDSGVTMSSNGTVYFRGQDGDGLISNVVSYTVSNIDRIAPDKPVANASTTEMTNKNVTITVTYSDDTATKQYSLDNIIWLAYTAAITMTANGTVYFRGIDAAGNISDVASYEVANIDKTAPAKPAASADITAATNKNVTVTASFSDDSANKEYSLDNRQWLTYTAGVTMTANGTVYFRAADAAGNISDVTEYAVSNIDKVAPVITLVGDTQSALYETSLTATVDDGSNLYYRIGNSAWLEYTAPITVRAKATYSFKATDAAGNIGTSSIVFSNIMYKAPANLVASKDALSWGTTGAPRYVAEYSMDSFEHAIRLTTTQTGLDSLNLPAGTYQWRVRSEDNGPWAQGESIISDNANTVPKTISSTANGNGDVFFATANGTWTDGYSAKHVGSVGDWSGTKELVSTNGKNRLYNLFFGSTDSNILLLTDDANGDALFVDDIYTELPGTVSQQQSRIAKIQEIRAGVGDDIVDMTSQRFEYIGDGLTIRGGSGNDTLWANKGDNMLFGDAGNDRLVGASGNDVLAGGMGNDRMHGGGGSDIFTFCDNWGDDKVEQLADGDVTLWFESGSLDNWDASTLTYTDGNNSVQVSGVTADKISLKFGDDGSEQHTLLMAQGAFEDTTSEKLFEEKGKGILAII